MSNSIGFRLKLRREELGLSQESVAKAVGVTKAAISHWERGQNKYFKEDHFENIIKALKTTKKFIKDGEEDQKEAIVYSKNTHQTERDHQDSHAGYAINPFTNELLTDTEKELLRLFNFLTDDQKQEAVDNIKVVADRNMIIINELQHKVFSKKS